MKKQTNYFVGIDLGGTKIASVLMNESGDVIRKDVRPTLTSEGPDAVISRMLESVNQVKMGYDIQGIGIGSPGPLDEEKGIVIHSSNLPGWKNVPICSILSEKLNTNVVLGNDANVAAVGEFLFGAGIGTTNMVYITISTGIGVGLILNGQLYNGSHRMGAEYGHTTILANGPICNCGDSGCWEACASGTAIGKYARQAIQADEFTLIKELAEKENGSPTAKHVFEAAKKGDIVANNIIDQIIFYNAIGMKNIIHTINPEKIIIGGGVAKAGQSFFEALTEKTNELIMPAYRGRFEIVPSKLGDDVGAIGAAALLL